MNRESSKHNVFAKVITKAVPKTHKYRSAIEITACHTPIQDVRFLCVAIDYPYMFECPISELTIDRRWAEAFTQTCVEVDRALGRSTHGFCWRMLDANNGEPNWFWALAPEYDQQVYADFDCQFPQVQVVNSQVDPAGNLRSTIQAIINKGKRRALAALDGAANDSDAFNPGGLQ